MSIPADPRRWVGPATGDGMSRRRAPPAVHPPASHACMCVRTGCEPPGRGPRAVSPPVWLPAVVMRFATGCHYGKAVRPPSPRPRCVRRIPGVPQLLVASFFPFLLPLLPHVPSTTPQGNCGKSSPNIHPNGTVLPGDLGTAGQGRGCCNCSEVS